MKILYLGDIMGRPGRETVEALLPALRAETGADLVIAQGENLTGGKGMKLADVEAMMRVGVDAWTGGNWTFEREEINPWLDDPARPVVRPANYPASRPGRRYKVVETPFGRVQIFSLLGQIVGYLQPEVEHPLKTADAILEETKHEKFAARIVNFHGDYSSEKVVAGQYLDGRVTALLGDHWHVPTADARVLPGGTAHMSDVGMVGSRDSCLGVKTEVIVRRWLDEHRSRNELEDMGARWLCAALIETDPQTGLARSIRQIIRDTV